ncbi:uncharacterized protein LOC134216207 [Armigeres subalbatus]|uniref:uncharacterized protein LOC134216207 n=1 Tax=Armigeres subalbatus TaxID=124917 RepID=UPI002ED52B92
MAEEILQEVLAAKFGSDGDFPKWFLQLFELTHPISLGHIHVERARAPQGTFPYCELPIHNHNCSKNVIAADHEMCIICTFPGPGLHPRHILRPELAARTIKCSLLVQAATAVECSKLHYYYNGYARIRLHRGGPSSRTSGVAVTDRKPNDRSSIRNKNGHIKMELLCYKILPLTLLNGLTTSCGC